MFFTAGLCHENSECIICACMFAGKLNRSTMNKFLGEMDIAYKKLRASLNYQGKSGFELARYGVEGPDRRLYMSKKEFGEVIASGQKTVSRRFYNSRDHKRVGTCYEGGFSLFLGGYSDPWAEVSLTGKPYFELLTDMPLEQIQAEGDSDSKTLFDFIMRGSCSKFFNNRKFSKEEEELERSEFLKITSMQVTVIHFELIRMLK